LFNCIKRLFGYDETSETLNKIHVDLQRVNASLDKAVAELAEWKKRVSEPAPPLSTEYVPMTDAEREQAEFDALNPEEYLAKLITLNEATTAAWKAYEDDPDEHNQELWDVYDRTSGSWLVLTVYDRMVPLLKELQQRRSEVHVCPKCDMACKTEGSEERVEKEVGRIVAQCDHMNSLKDANTKLRDRVAELEKENKELKAACDRLSVAFTCREEGWNSRLEGGSSDNNPYDTAAESADEPDTRRDWWELGWRAADKVLQQRQGDWATIEELGKENEELKKRCEHSEKAFSCRNEGMSAMLANVAFHDNPYGADDLGEDSRNWSFGWNTADNLRTNLFRENAGERRLLEELNVALRQTANTALNDVKELEDALRPFAIPGKGNFMEERKRACQVMGVQWDKS
jgi:predicted nuclease with TOPRIM domain